MLPHRPGIFLVGYFVLKNWLVRMERENALPRIIVRDMNSGDEHAIAFDEEAYSLGFGEMREYDTDILRFTYSSMTTPAQVFDYNMRDRTRVLRKTQEVPSGHEPANYVTRRILAPAHDGELIPVTLLYRKSTPLNGTAPLWLYGYGSYGISIPAGFNTNILSLVDRGFIYAIAHIRGGEEKGRRWYKTGKLEHKNNTFRDFISCAEHLIKAGFTTKGNIVAQGGSAGGMLMGAVANRAGELFAGLVAELHEVTQRARVGLGQMAELGLGQVLLLGGPERELDGVVTVDLVRAHGGDRTGTGLQDGDALDAAVLHEELGHPELLGENGSHHATSLISMSTPAGRWSRRWSESTVLGVG